MTVTFRKIANSEKSAHQQVFADDSQIGEVWREQVTVVVSKMLAPRKMAQKWRWFGKRTGESTTLGRGTRSSMLLGPGYKSKDDAAAEIIRASQTGTGVQE